MEVLAGPYAAAAALLALGGAPKVLRPEPAVRALASVGLPGSPMLVRLLGAFETCLAAAALTVGGRAVAALVAVSYVAFAAFVAVAMVRGGVLSSCGCFARPDTPPSAGHVAGNLVAAAIAGIVAWFPAPGLLRLAAAAPVPALPLVTLAGCCAWFAYLALTRLPPRAAAGRRRP